MKRVYINEEWCLGCHLCEYNCFLSNSKESDMVLACMGKNIKSNLHIEDSGDIHFAFNCRHCKDPICIKACISGALHKEGEVVVIDKEKCVFCGSCILVCPYGALMESESGVMQKCELCISSGGVPKCVEGCPNGALVFEER